ncbi:MAG: M20 metallopeptidase family protein [Persicimonas sp.]
MQSPTEFLTQIDQLLEDRNGELISLRRELHSHPELSHKEYETTAMLAATLEDIGFEVHVREEGTGFYADLVPDGFNPKTDPTVAIRTDIDALPIKELNDIPYRSQDDGVMHACGHDVHMTVATGAGIAIKEVCENLSGRLRLLYQHAEEVSPGGAAEMVSFGAVEGVDAILALHCDPELEVGRIGVREGHLTAAFDRFEFKIIGKSGHGARPHHCTDPVRVATQVANALYQVPSQYFDSRDSVVISIGAIYGGDSPNVIPEEVTMTGTIRTLSSESRAKMEPLLQKVAGGICMGHGASYELDIESGAPSVFNDSKVIGVVEDVAREVLGDTGVYEIPLPSMGGEDFAYYLQHTPGAMFRLGTAGPGPRARHFLHSSKFDVDERAIGIGARILARSALELMSRLATGEERFKRPRPRPVPEGIAE